MEGGQSRQVHAPEVAMQTICCKMDWPPRLTSLRGIACSLRATSIKTTDTNTSRETETTTSSTAITASDNYSNKTAETTTTATATQQQLQHQHQQQPPTPPLTTSTYATTTNPHFVIFSHLLLLQDVHQVHLEQVVPTIGTAQAVVLRVPNLGTHALLTPLPPRAPYPPPRPPPLQSGGVVGSLRPAAAAAAQCLRRRCGRRNATRVCNISRSRRRRRRFCFFLGGAGEGRGWVNGGGRSGCLY